MCSVGATLGESLVNAGRAAEAILPLGRALGWLHEVVPHTLTPVHAR